MQKFVHIDAMLCPFRQSNSSKKKQKQEPDQSTNQIIEKYSPFNFARRLTLTKEVKKNLSGLKAPSLKDTSDGVSVQEAHYRNIKVGGGEQRGSA